MGIFNSFNGFGNKTVINGKEINIPPGSNVSIVGNQIFINGKPYEGNEELKQAHVTFSFEGTEPSVVHVKGSLNIQGDVKAERIEAASINCDNIMSTNVHANGSINCDDIEGDVSAHGSVNCDDVTGNVKAKTVIRG